MIGNRTKNASRDPKRSWSSALRSPWTVACATAAVVVLGPSAVIASALDRANAAPPHGASPSAPEHPAPGQGRRHHIQPYTTEQYAYVPRTPSRGPRA